MRKYLFVELKKLASRDQTIETERANTIRINRLLRGDGFDE